MVKNNLGSYDVAAGEIIFREGDDGDCAYIIETGRVLIYVNKDKEEVPLTILGPGEIIGEMSLIDNQKRSANVRSLEQSQISQVTKDQLVERMAQADPIVRVLLRVLLKRLRASNIGLDMNDPIVALAADNKITGGNESLDSSFDSIKKENEIFSAFQNNEFELFYQPIINLKDRSIIGCEALLRWQSPTKGLVFPNAFIDVIENSAMVIPIGEWIIERAMDDLKKIQAVCKDSKLDKLGNNFMMSVNISGRQFAHPQFLENLEKKRLAANVPVKNVKLEITERIMMEGSLAIEVLNNCNKKGYKISIDDFGTGFSSLQYLTQMPISYLKIDRSFVKRLQLDEKSMAVVNSIIYLAKALDVEIIAEGIESEAEAILLRGLGAHLGQGYLYSKPVPLSSFMSLIENI